MQRMFKEDLLKRKETKEIQSKPIKKVKMEKVTNSIPSSQQMVEYETLSEGELKCYEEMNSNGSIVEKKKEKKNDFIRVVQPFDLEKSIHEESFGIIQSNVNNLVGKLKSARMIIDDSRKMRNQKYYEGRELKIHKEINGIREMTARKLEIQFYYTEQLVENIVRQLQHQATTIDQLTDIMCEFGGPENIGSLINLTKRTANVEKCFKKDQ